jgi:cytochrome c oxidase cbb3-type subunit 3
MMRWPMLAAIVLVVAGTRELALRAAPAARAAQGARPAGRDTTPSASSARSVADGARLFVAYNCADCHGGGGSGLMAPSLADNRWRYGGSPREIFASITEGRPEGMPKWGPLIPPSQVWQIVAYVGSLGTGKDVSTMNFTGAQVKRTGHD